MPYRLLPGQETYTVSGIDERSWLTIIGCDQGHSSTWTGPELVAKFPLDATIGQIAERLRCGTCGSTDGSIGFVQEQSERARRRGGRKVAGPPHVYSRK